MVTNILKDEIKKGDGEFGTLEIEENSISMLSSNANPTSTPAKSRTGFFKNLLSQTIKQNNSNCPAVM